ncbi:MAG: LuxR C-terminal-related transcriptional regulator [Chloroflexota bacterium]
MLNAVNAANAVVQPLLTKLYIPTPRRKLVERDGLLHALDEGLNQNCRLTLVSAPPGYGKTTLVAAWLESLRQSDPGRKLAWLTLSEADNEPLQFLGYVIAALQQASPEVGQVTQELLGAPQIPAWQSLQSSLLNEMARCEDRLLLVLDDYHLIQNTSIQEALSFWVDNLPPQCHLVMTTRADPPLPLARWRARGQLNELRQAGLRFTTEETTAFMREVMHLEMAQPDLLALQARTEGWAAGLQLAALAFTSASKRSQSEKTGASQFIQSFSAGDRYILDYLIGEVLEQQPAALQGFLLRTSILERLNSALCAALLGQAWESMRSELASSLGPGGPATTWDAQALLEHLESANLFLTHLDDRREWFCYHKLFRDLLLHRLQRQHRDEVAGLHCRAADWYAHNGYVTDALAHWLQAGEIPAAVELVEHNAVLALAHGDTYTLRSWLDALPADQVGQHPWLGIYRAWVLLLSGQVSALEAHLADFTAPEQVALEDQNIQGHLAAIRAYAALFQPDVPAASALAHQALAQLPPDEAVVRAFVTFTLGGIHLMQDDLDGAVQAFQQAARHAQAAGNVHIAVPALRVLAQFSADQGLLHQAHQICLEALHLATQGGKRPGLLGADVLGRLSAILYEWNDLQASLEYAQRAVTLGEQWGNLDSQVGSYARLWRVHLALGDETGARQALNQAARMVTEHRLTPGTADNIAYCQVYAWLRQGDLQQVERWARAPGRFDPGQPISYVNEAGYRALARLRLAQGAPDQALQVLERLDRWTQAHNLAGKAIEILLLRALALQAQGQAGPALKALGQALYQAEAEGYRRSFTDEGPELARLLEQALAQQIAPRYAQALLSAFPEGALQADVSAAPPAAILDPLSQRELEVLALIEQGLSNQQIAERLVISLGTVKAHTASIYRKLGVNSRTQALVQARESGLL